MVASNPAPRQIVAEHRRKTELFQIIDLVRRRPPKGKERSFHIWSQRFKDFKRRYELTSVALTGRMDDIFSKYSW